MGTAARITDRHPQNTVLVTEQRIRRRELIDLLAVLLEDILPVVGLLQEFGNVDLTLHEGLDKREHNVKPIAAIGPQSSDEGLQNVTQLLRIRAPMDRWAFLIVSRNHLKLGQTDLLGKLSETLIIDEFLAEIREEPLLLVRLTLSKLGGNTDTQHGIPLELQAFLGVVKQVHHARWARSELRRLPIRSSLFRTTNLGRMHHGLLKDLGILHSVRRQSVRLQHLANVLFAKCTVLAVVRDLELHTSFTQPVCKQSNAVPFVFGRNGFAGLSR